MISTACSPALVEEILQNVDDEFHRRVVVVQDQDFVERRLLGLRACFRNDAGSRSGTAIADQAIAIALISHRLSDAFRILTGTGLRFATAIVTRGLYRCSFKKYEKQFTHLVMAALEAAIHPARVHAPKDSFARGRERDGWPGRARPWRILYAKGPGQLSPSPLHRPAI